MDEWRLTQGCPTRYMDLDGLMAAGVAAAIGHNKGHDDRPPEQFLTNGEIARHIAAIHRHLAKAEKGVWYDGDDGHIHWAAIADRAMRLAGDIARRNGGRTREIACNQ